MPHRYPRHWEADVVTRDGATMHVRPILPSDADALQRLHLSQSEQSRVFRFFGARGALTAEELDRFTQVDHRSRVALVVTEGTSGPLCAMGCYDAVDGATAEVAFYVGDAHQGRGLGSILLDHLAAAGRERGFRRFTAEVLPTNRRMLSVFREAGYSTTAVVDEGIVEVSLDLTTTTEAWRVMTAREQYAESRSMLHLMTPESVVAVGSGAAGRVLDHLPALPRWDGAPTGGRVLAVVAVDDDALAGTVRDLGRAGVRAAVVLSGRDTTDAAWHLALLKAARSGGMRILGPGSLGIASPAAGILTAVPAPRLGGELGVFAQGARSSAAILRRLRARGIPVEGFISAGHRIDISGNDAMQWWSGDGSTRVVALSLDSIGNPRKFARTARHLARTHTVVCHIGSRTGQMAPPGHVVRTSPLPRAVLSDMLRQAGVLEARDLDELVDLAQVALRLPPAPRHRLRLAATTAAAADHVRRVAAGRFECADDGEVGVAVDLPLPGDEVSDPGWAGSPTTWTLAILDRDLPPALAGTFATDDAARAIDLAGRVAAGARPVDDSPLVHADDAVPGRLAALLARAAEGPVDGPLAAEMLACYGITVEPTECAGTEEEALAAAARLGWPLAVKAVLPHLRHRVDLGGVHLDVHDAADLSHAVAELRDRGVALVELQRMVPPGPACVVTAVEDPLHGPVVSVALAGDAVEILGDVAYRIAPLSRRDVSELVRAPKAAVRLSGHRGVPAFDIAALEDVVARVAQMKDDFPAIRRIELNPVVVAAAGAFPLAARIEVDDTPRADGVRRTLPTLPTE